MNFLKHRKPDDNSIGKKNNFAISFQKLTIENLSKNGKQPMISENGRYIIVYNGEIYIFLDLKKNHNIGTVNLNLTLSMISNIFIEN